MLHYDRLDPGFMIGGIVSEFNSNFNIGQGQYFVVEGDEYDTAFFDKGPKFLHYQPHILIITSIEFDHADIYANLDQIKANFKKLVEIMPEHGLIIANFDDLNVRDIIQSARCPVMGYGQNDQFRPDWLLTDINVTLEGTGFTVVKRENTFGRFITSMPGRHNAMNSIAVIAALDHIGIKPEQIIVRRPFPEP